MTKTQNREIPKKGEKYLYHQKTANKNPKLLSKVPYLKLITEKEQWNTVLSEIEMQVPSQIR